MDDKINIAIVRWDLSDDYNRHTATTMASVMENCSKPVVFHILHEEKNSFVNCEKVEENIKKYHELIKNKDAEIVFHNVILPEWINEQNIHVLKEGALPMGLYRLFLPEILSNIDKVVTLGSDTIVKTDLAKFVSLLPDTYSLAGCIDGGMDFFIKHPNNNLTKYYLSMGVDLNSYVNADVLIFNLKKIREQYFLPDAAKNFFYKHPEALLLEQDALNAVFKNDIFILDSRYNLAAGYGCTEKGVESVKKLLNSTENDIGYIIHYVGSGKPWNEYLSELDLEYWHYLAKTPWANDGEIVDFMWQVLRATYEKMLNPEELLKRYPIKRKIQILWSMSFPLYWKEVIAYIKYIKWIMSLKKEPKKR